MIKTQIILTGLLMFVVAGSFHASEYILLEPDSSLSRLDQYRLELEYMTEQELLDEVEKKDQQIAELEESIRESEYLIKQWMGFL